MFAKTFNETVLACSILVGLTAPASVQAAAATNPPTPPSNLTGWLGTDTNSPIFQLLDNTLTNNNVTNFIVPLNRLPPIAAGRTFPWEESGVIGGVKFFPNSVNVMNYGAKADGVSDDRAAFVSAISACSTGGAVLVPAGTYYLSSSVSIPSSKVVRGAGPNSTIIKHNGFAFTISGPGSTYFTITATVPRGSTNVTVSSTSGLAVGDWCRLQEATQDPSVMFGHLEESYPLKVQWVRVTGISGSTVSLNRPAYLDYNLSFTPQLRKSPTIVTNAGVESIGFQQQSSGGCIQFYVSANCWVTNICTTNCSDDTGDIAIYDSTHITVAQNTLLCVQGTSSQYGIHLHDNSGECLIYDNIVDQHTGPILLQAGTAGNVIAYNYIGHARESKNYGIITHGSFSWFNLFEGNVCAWLAADSYWGNNYRETWFRNWATGYHTDAAGNHTESYWAGMVNANNWYFNVVGNVFGYPITNGITDLMQTANDDAGGYYDGGASLTNIFLHGNYGFVGRSTTWSSGYSTNLPNSYYLASKPSWFGSLAWPPIGPDVNTTSSITNKPVIPAQARFLGKSY
jgi:hypothetical protein